MASIAGVGAPGAAIADPSLIVVVRAARYASGVSASWPQTSGTQTEAAPSRSASATKAAPSGPVTCALIPTCMDEAFRRDAADPGMARVVAPVNCRLFTLSRSALPSASRRGAARRHKRAPGVSGKHSGGVLWTSPSYVL